MGGVREYKYGRQLLKLSLRSESDESVFREIFQDRDYMMVDDLIAEASGLILDIGGHIGLFSIYARGLNDNVPIIAYEPEPENFAAMKEHLKANHIPGVVVKNAAIAAKDGLSVLYLSEDSHNHSLFDFLKQKIVKEVRVPTVSMDKIINRDLPKMGLASIDLIKMDVEGAEFEILESMDGELFEKVNTLFVEYHEYFPDKNRNDLVKLLQSNGFRTRLTENRYDDKYGTILAYRSF